MANSKIIIVEGPQGVGKTTITDFIRNSISYTNLYRLCGTKDLSIEGKNKSVKMYETLLDYIKNLENTSVNLLFDITFFTEEVYCRLGLKEYSFTDEYNKLLDRLSKMDFDIYYIALYLRNEDDYIKRLDRPGKASFKNAEFNKENSVKQQNEYLKLADEIKTKYPSINVLKIDNSRKEDVVKKEILDILDWKD